MGHPGDVCGCREEAGEPTEAVMTRRLRGAGALRRPSRVTQDLALGATDALLSPHMIRAQGAGGRAAGPRGTDGRPEGLGPCYP